MSLYSCFCLGVGFGRGLPFADLGLTREGGLGAGVGAISLLSGNASVNTSAGAAVLIDDLSLSSGSTSADADVDVLLGLVCTSGVSECGGDVPRLVIGLSPKSSFTF